MDRALSERVASEKAPPRLSLVDLGVAIVSAAVSVAYVAEFGARMGVIGLASLLFLALVGSYFVCRRFPARSKRSTQSAIAEAAEETDAIFDLEGELRSFGADRAVEQLGMLQMKYRNLTDVLGRRFKDGEITYARYAEVAASLFESSLDSLKEVAITLKAGSQIDVARSRERLSAISRQRGVSAPSQEETALKARLALADGQQQRIDDLYGQCEAAMTVLDQASAALASTKTATGADATDIAAAMQAMEELAARTKLYAAR
jgi:hypothetical protein